MGQGLSSDGIAALAEQVSRVIHSTGYAEGLYPAHWTALRYFAWALPASRTTASLARFQGMSLGPVARTVRTLVEKGLLARAANPQSRRADLIAVTADGHRLLERDPQLKIREIVERMPPEHQAVMADALGKIILDLFARSRTVEGPAAPDGDADEIECDASEV